MQNAEARITAVKQFRGQILLQVCLILIAINGALPVKERNGNEHIAAALLCIFKGFLRFFHGHMLDDITENDEIIPIIFQIGNIGAVNMAVFFGKMVIINVRLVDFNSIHDEIIPQTIEPVAIASADVQAC